MKHCLNCYRKIPNDATQCHYCGASQAEQAGFPGEKVMRCPHCMSYLYDEEHGCQNCGLTHKKKSNARKWLFGLAFVVLVLFVLWQLGLFPGLPAGGKAAKLISLQFQNQPAETQSPEQALSDIPIVPLTEDLAAEGLPLPAENETADPAEPAAAGIVASTATVVAPTSTPAAFQCNGMENRLRPDQSGQLRPGGNPSKLRSKPTIESDTLKVLYGGAPFVVINEKPVCADGYLWIKVRLDEYLQEGWTVEADQSDYWLVQKEPDSAGGDGN